MEEEQADVAVLGMAVDVDVVAERVAGCGQAAVLERQLASEKPVDAFAPVEEVDPQPGDQEQVGLPGFDEDTGRHAAVVQVPGIRMDVGFGVDGAESHGARFARQAGDAVDQQQRRLRQPDLAAEPVLFLEQRPQHLRDAARCQDLEIGSGDGPPCGLGRRPARAQEMLPAFLLQRHESLIKAVLLFDEGTVKGGGPSHQEGHRMVRHRGFGWNPGRHRRQIGDGWQRWRRRHHLANPHRRQVGIEAEGPRRGRGNARRSQRLEPLPQCRQIDVHSRHEQLRRDVEHLVDRRTVGLIEGQRQVFPIPQGVVDGGCQDVARAVLEEQAHAVVPGVLDGAPEVDGVEGLAEQCIGHTLGVRAVGAVGGVGVEADPVDRLRGAVMDLPPGFGERFQFAAMHDHGVAEVDGARRPHLV